MLDALLLKAYFLYKFTIFGKKMRGVFCNWKKNNERKLLLDLLKIMQVWGSF